MHLSGSERAQADDGFSGNLPDLTLGCHEGSLLQCLEAPCLAPASHSGSRNPVSDSHWRKEGASLSVPEPLLAIVSLIISPRAFGEVCGDFTPVR